MDRVAALHGNKNNTAVRQLHVASARAHVTIRRPSPGESRRALSRFRPNTDAATSIRGLRAPIPASRPRANANHDLGRARRILVTLRLGTFNAQTLFERAEAGILHNEAEIAAILQEINAFRGHLNPTHCDNAAPWASDDKRGQSHSVTLRRP